MKKVSGEYKPHNLIERKAKRHYEKRGYTELHKGWPDFLLYKNGKIRLVEIKPINGDVSYSQELMFWLIERHIGIEVEVKRKFDKRENLYKPTLVGDESVGFMYQAVKQDGSLGRKRFWQNISGPPYRFPRL